MQKVRPKVSVIVPVWGVEKYIEKCARSLFEQTLDDVEYIFVDDCTPDDSIQILKRVVAEYPERIQQTRIIKMPSNGGQAAVRRRGIIEARGEYIIHCDSDDWVERNWLKALYNHAVQTGAELVWCDFFKNLPDGGQRRISMKSAEEKSRSIGEVMSGRRLGSVCSCLVKREVVKNDEIEYALGNYGEDIVLVIQYIILCNKQSYLPQAFYHYRTNEQSITQIQSREQILRNMDTMVRHNQLIQQVCKKHGYLKAVIAASRGRMFRAKDKVLQLYSDDRQAASAWKNFHPELNFRMLMQSNLSLRQKIYASVIFSGLYPYVNRIVNLKKRMAW